MIFEEMYRRKQSFQKLSESRINVKTFLTSPCFSAPFPPDMKKCSGWFDGIKPTYTIKYAEKTPAKAEDEIRKVQPLKIKKAQISGGPASVIKPPPLTPSPLLQRESREWKPSSQFFKPLNAGMFCAM